MIRPIAVPSTVPSRVASRLISRMSLAPTMTREKTSRPSWSVPNQCAADGGWFVASSCWASGSCGAMASPNTAQTTQNSRIAAPARNVGLRSSSRQGGSSADTPRLRDHHPGGAGAP